jgi:hypothetical protein
MRLVRTCGRDRVSARRWSINSRELLSATLRPPCTSRPIDVVGIGAGVITFAGGIWYDFSILSSRTRPDRAVRWILSLSWILLASSHDAIGGVTTMVVPLIFALSVVVTAILPNTNGSSRCSRTSASTRSAMLLIIRKTMQHRGSEAPGPWVVTILGDLVNVLAIGDARNEWLLPVYLLASNGCMLVVILTTDSWLLRPRSRLMQRAVRHSP